MPRFDLPAEQLRTYRPKVNEPKDFDEFWQRTLAESRALAQPTVLTRIESPLALFEVYDLSFSGFGGDQVRGWFIVPKGAEGPLPTIVEYNGYGGGRGLPHERIGWAASGYAWAFMDSRGQGSVWGTGGDTPDPHGTGPSVPGFMTRGIEDPEQYYYRRVFTDAALFIDAVREFDAVDENRIAVTGGSQGGGIAIAAAGLSEGLIGAMPEVPFLCHFERAVGMTDTDPYGEVVRYLAVHRNVAEQAFRTLSYFDCVSLAARAQAPGLYSVGLLDPICPPSTVFAAANHHLGGAEVVEYPFNEHEGGQGFHWQRQVQWFSERVKES